MYRLMIVDDDDLIRDSMADHVDWASMGFSVVARLEDGKNAIEYLQSHPVEAVLTDVIMYEVSGIALSKYISEHCPHTKVVILSGYREFEFVQEAVRFGVFNYILKPIDMGELQAVFTRLREALDAERRPDTQNLPLIYFDAETYALLLALTQELAAAVAAADTAALSALTGRMAAHAGSAPTNVKLFLISHLLVKVYEQINQAGIAPQAVLPLESMQERLCHLQADTIFPQMHLLLHDLCVSIREHRKSGSNVVEKARQYILAHLNVKFSVEDVAKSVYLSSGYLSRAFRAVVGESLMDYAIRMRMERAATMIRNGEGTFGEIAAAVGYTDQAYFHRSFKKYVGCTVREYRKHA